MAVLLDTDTPESAGSIAPRRPNSNRIILHGVQVMRQGRVEPFLDVRPRLSSAGVQWGGVALEDYTTQACLIPHHEHLEHFLHVVLRGSVKYEVITRGRTLSFTAHPGTTFILPRGTVDEIRWGGPTHRLAVAIHPRLLTNSLEETAHMADVELTEHWDLLDRHITAILLEMAADIGDGTPAGKMYGESLANALAVYLVKRYAVRPRKPDVYKRVLPGHRLKRILDYVGDNLAMDLSLAQLAEVAGMSPHYFAELFKQSTGHAPHSYVLLQRIERAKQRLLDPKLSIIEAGLEAGFQNPSHFGRMFRKFVGTTPSKFRAELLSGGRHQGVTY